MGDGRMVWSLYTGAVVDRGSLPTGLTLLRGECALVLAVAPVAGVIFVGVEGQW